MQSSIFPLSAYPSEPHADVYPENEIDFSQHGEAVIYELPDEVWLEVFGHVDLEDVDNVLVVNRRFHRIANDAAYREIFKHQYGQVRFNRTTTSLGWRSELIARTEALRKWRRGGGGAHAKPNISCNPGLRHISHIEPDFDTHRTIVFSQDDGIGMVADHTRGKIAKPRLGTDQALQPHNSVHCISASRFGIIFGMVTGKVSAMQFSHDMRARTYIKLDKFHNGPVQDVWIDKESAPSKNIISALSAGADGIIYSWDLESGTALEEFDLGEPLLKIGVTEKKTIIALDQTGALRAVDTDSKLSRTIGKFPFNCDRSVFFEVTGESVFVAQKQKLMRFDTDGSSYDFAIHFIGSAVDIVALAVDRTVFPSWITSRGAPGDNWSYIAVADNHWNIHVFAGVTRGAGAANAQGNTVEVEPLVLIEHDHPIESLSMNSVVMLISTKMGATSMRDVLTGRFLGIACGEAHYKPRRGPLVQGPSQTFVDANPQNAQGITSVGGVLMFFDLGAKVNSLIKKKGVQQDPRRLAQSRRRHSSNGHESNGGAAMKAAIKQELELMADDDEHREHISQFTNDEMNEDEELEYALMLSRGDTTSASYSEGEGEEELLHALEASRADEESEENKHHDYNDDDDDDELLRAIEASMSDVNISDSTTASPALHPTSSLAPIGSNQIHSSTGDPDLDLALALSLSEQ